MEEYFQVQIGLLENMISETSNQIERIEKFTDRLLAKLSSIITLSGIISFLSFAFIPGNGSLVFVKYYLAWVLPLLIFAVTVWIITFRKSKAVILDRLDFIESQDPRVTFQYLIARLQMYNDLHRSTNRIYRETRAFVGVSLSLIVIYLLNFILSFYLFIFAKLPTVTEAILIEFVMFFVADVFLRLYTKAKTVSVTKTIHLKPPSSVTS